MTKISMDSQACAARIVSLCRDPFHITCIMDTHLTAVFSVLKIEEATGLHYHCISVLDCIARSDVESEAIAVSAVNETSETSLNLFSL